MQVILLKSVHNLGKLGDLVNVKDGYARNFLIPSKKALYSTEANKKLFDATKSELNKKEAEHKAEAISIKAKTDGKFVSLIERASDDGQLYGSVSAALIAKTVAKSLKIENLDRKQVRLHNPIKQLGVFEVEIEFHPEVVANIFINVAQSEADAKKAEKDFVKVPA
jgi:large subunit ribosomal protein L9